MHSIFIGTSIYVTRSALTLANAALSSLKIQNQNSFIYHLNKSFWFYRFYELAFFLNISRSCTPFNCLNKKKKTIQIFFEKFQSFLIVLKKALEISLFNFVFCVRHNVIRYLNHVCGSIDYTSVSRTGRCLNSSNPLLDKSKPY